MSTAPCFAPRAVLFDLDGTLLDTIADLTDAANLMLAELGRARRPQHEIHSFVGKGLPKLVERCLTDGAQEVPAQAAVEAAISVFRRHYERVNGMRTTIYPGVVDALRVLRRRNIRLAVVTNKPEAFTLPLLERTGLTAYFDTVVSGDTLPVKKPDPAMVLLACERLGVAPDEALMVGDSANDALSAQGAGMPVLLVSYGYSEGAAVDTIECDGLLSSALQVLDYIVPA